MSLFRCELCGGIENTACCWDNKKEVITELSSEKGDYPNMGLMDMQGFGDEFKLDGIVWKSKDEIKMLCSECNTGKWHGEWEKEYATAEEDVVANYSKYSFTTKFDHEDGVFKKDVIDIPNSHNSELNIVYDVLHKLYVKETGLDSLNKLGSSEHLQYQMLYKIMLEEGYSLELEDVSKYEWLYHLDKPLIEVEDIKEFAEIVFRLLPTKSTDPKGIELTTFGLLIHLLNNDKCSTVKEFYEHALLSESIKSYRQHNKTTVHGASIEKVNEIMKSLGKNFGISQDKKHWKETQSEEDRNKRIAAAIEKRNRKGKL